MKRIGILGGTFNPIHIGHLVIAQTACEHLGLSRVIFVPSNLPPHKSSRLVVDGKQRYAMIKLAIKNNKQFRLSKFEISREGKSFTIDTVKYFREKYGTDTKLYFIMGSDTYATLDMWRDITEISKLVTFAAIHRPGEHSPKHKIKAKQIWAPGLDIASTQLRNKLRDRKAIRYIIPDEVLDYIKQHRLYR